MPGDKMNNIKGSIKAQEAENSERKLGTMNKENK